MKFISDYYTKKLIGKTEQEAEKILNKDKVYFRIVCRDGISFWVTQDIREDRINLNIKNNKVIEAYIG